MAFGFGSSNNNNNTTSGFGGFGSGNSGFGANNNNNASTTSSLFGGGNTATSGTFGTGGGFGSTNTSSPFGAKPAGGFGATATSSGGSLFGGNTSTTGGFGSGGGFGATNNNASTGFGSTNTGGGMFGQPKPATGGFGSTNNSGGSIFGGGNNTTSGGFGANTNNANTSNPFSANTGSTGFGANNAGTNTSFGGFGASNTAAAANNNNNNGTASTPFNPFAEKDQTSNQTSHYQSITFQQPYQGKSFEELRVEDYMQGRRYGNTNGQAGSFGTSTGFGGSMFGSNNQQNANSGSGLFGNNSNSNNNNNTTTTTGTTGFGGFGANSNNNQQQSTSGFGSNTSGGGLFGQNKPATSRLFGSPQTTGTTTGGFGSTSGAGGGLFATGGGFGANTNNNPQQSGGLFGTNQQQNKPAFGGFGASNTSSNTGGFGTNNNTTGGGLFGGTANNNTNTGGGLFGQNNNNTQQQNSNPFGGSTNTPGGLFGTNQNKPATGGLFGGNSNTSNTGSGLFGANNNQQQSGGLFGPNNNNQQSGGLFGANNQNKPATTSLFGGSSANTNTGGGLFGGNNSTQQPGGSLFGGNNTTGSSLFGGNNQNKPAGSSLFGGNTSTANTGGGLFGALGQNNQQSQQSTGGGLFSGSLGQSNQNQQGGNNSLFGNSFQTPQQNQLHASLTVSPYGSDQLFSSLAQASTPVGPLATPLNGSKPVPNKTPSLLSSTRLNSPIYTPRASGLNRTGTYGLSYSTFGTPSSAYSSTSLTPQQTSLLKPSGSLGSALTSRLAKSMSMNNLRGDGTPREGESLLRPTPGSSSSRYLQSGSMRKLIIDRSLRADLFAPPDTMPSEAPRGSVDGDAPGLRKKVSFDNSASKQSTAEPSAANALVRTEEPEEETAPGPIRAAPGSRPRPNVAPEMRQVNGSGLGTAQESGGSGGSVGPAPGKKPAADDDGYEGEYWTKPAIKDLKNMSRAQLSKLGKFAVGRENVGFIEFGPCDLTNTNLDDICGKICDLRRRTATVYPIEATKPPRGQGLNVPATIHLEHSYPRNKKAAAHKSGPVLERHLARLRSIENTAFKSYDPETGVWVFTVEHFTTYGLEGDADETEDMDIEQESSELSELPRDDTLQSLDAPSGSPDDDTFGQQKMRKLNIPRIPAAHVPGGFGFEDMALDDDQGMNDEQTMSSGLGEVDEIDPFIAAGGAVQAPSPDAIERFHSSMMTDDDAGAVDFAEETQDEPEHARIPGAFNDEPKLLRSILKPTAAMSTFTSPDKLANDAWEEQLQRTMSPRKRDRQVLKELQQGILQEQADDTYESPFKRSMLGQSMLGQSALGQSYLAQKSAKKASDHNELGKSQAFRTSMDIMNSLWAQGKTTKKAAGGTHGFENPYLKKPRLSATSELNKQDAMFHDNLKPSFANDGTIIYTASGSAPPVGEPLAPKLVPLVGEHKEVRFARWKDSGYTNTPTLSVQKNATATDTQSGFPHARTASDILFRDLESATATDSENQEKAIWKLTDVLFDTVVVACRGLTSGMSADQILEYESRLRTDAFGIFWKQILEPVVAKQTSLAGSVEEKALLRLTVNDVAGAADLLAGAKDFKLASLVAQLPGTAGSRDLMKRQIQSWLSRNDWSEMPDPIRAIYSIVAGDVCTVAGKNGPAENRASSFCVSEQFGLSWKQALGLRVFFGGHDTLEEGIVAYQDDLREQRERVTPLPPWAPREPEHVQGREDVLLELLNFFASPVQADDLARLFDAKTITGCAANSRIAWQLATLFHAKGRADELADEKIDQLTVGFAAELEAVNSFVSAIWVLLHLKDEESRRKAVTDVLFRKAALIGEPKKADAEDGTWEHLVNVERLPAELLWAAKALHARAELGDAFLQTEYLLNAGEADEAHDIVCVTLGPQAIISEEYEALQALLDRLANCRVDEGWEHGGRVFADFVRLVTMPTDRKQGREGYQLMKRLTLGLQGMQGVETSMGLEQKVALIEMDRVLKEEIRALHASGQGSEDVQSSTSMEGVEGSDGALSMDGFARYQQALGVVA